MKKLLLVLLVLISAVCYGQYPPGRLYNPVQRLGSDSALVRSYGGFNGRLINWSYLDTTAANMTAIKNYAGAQIFTTRDSSIWIRNTPANRWLLGGGGSIVNIINNNYTTITNLGDTAAIICTGVDVPVCDTFFFSIDSINNIFFIDDTTLVACDTPQVIQIGDEFITQQLCDTIRIPKQLLYRFLNGVQEITPGTVVFGSPVEGYSASQLQYNTYLNTDFYGLFLSGKPPNHELLKIDNVQNPAVSGSITSFNHLGRVSTDAIDSNNTVRLYINYATPFSGDTTGYFGDGIGYMINSNGRGTFNSLSRDDDVGKQSGIVIHTKDTLNTDGVTIFASQDPLSLCFTCLPAPTQTLYDKRVAVFKTDQNIQFPNYPNTRNNGTAGVAVFPIDTQGNLGVGAVAGGSTITIINDTTITICSFGDYLCDTFITEQQFQHVHILNDSMLLVCDTLGICDTLNIPQTGFDRGFFDPNQISNGHTDHHTSGYNFAVTSAGTISPTGTSDNFLWGNGGNILANATRNFVAIKDNTVSGSENTVFGRNMVVAGNTNFVAATDGQVFSTANYSSTFGDATINRGTAALTANFGNKNWAENGATFGSNNVNGSLNPTVGTANLYSNSFVSGLNNFSLGHVNFVSGSGVTANNTTGFITMFGKDYTVTTANSFNVGYTTNAFEITQNKVRINSARFQEFHGTTTAAANDLTLPNNGNSVTISGATTINAITTTNWQAGSTIGLIFTGAPLLKHNTAGGAGTATMLLAGSVDFQAAAGDNIEFRYDGTNWHEIGRTIATGGGGGLISADNGLTANTTTNVQLGAETAGASFSPLLHNTFINVAAFTLDVTGTSEAFKVNTVTAGNAVTITNTGAGNGAFSIANGGHALIGQGTYSSTGGIEEVLRLNRYSSGTPVNGAGLYIGMNIETATTTAKEAARVGAAWTDVTDATRTGEIQLYTTLSGTPGQKAVLTGSGQLGLGIYTGLTATRLEVVDNSIAAQSMVKLTTSSTASLTGSKLLEITRTGASGTGSQNTWGLYVVNSHSGTTPVNNAILGEINNSSGSGTAVLGRANGDGTGISGLAGTGNSVQGTTTSGTGGSFTSTSGAGVVAISSSGTGLSVQSTTGLGTQILINPATTNSIASVLRLNRQTTGTPTAGIGGQIEFYNEDDNSSNLSASIASTWTDVANATRTGDLQFWTTNSASSTLKMTIAGNGRTMLFGRLEMQQGADVASVAGAIAVGLDGNVFELTGTNAVTLISNLNFVNGSVIYLLFTSTATLTDGTANSGTDIGMELLGNANFVGSAEDVVVLVLSEIGGTQRWRMVSSSVN